MSFDFFLQSKTAVITCNNQFHSIISYRNPVYYTRIYTNLHGPADPPSAAFFRAIQQYGFAVPAIPPVSTPSRNDQIDGMLIKKQQASI